nr:hypothetical protein [Tanacetum cinerariifolium]
MTDRTNLLHNVQPKRRPCVGSGHFGPFHKSQIVRIIRNSSSVSEGYHSIMVVIHEAAWSRFPPPGEHLVVL